MKKAFWALFFSLATSPVFGISLLGEPMPLVPQVLTNDCPNFSGVWSGQCSMESSGQQTNENFRIEIKQDGCEKMFMNGQNYIIPGNYDSSGGNQHVSGSVAKHLTWDDSKTKLTVRYVSTQLAPYSGDQSFSGMGQQTFQLVGERLSVQGQESSRLVVNGQTNNYVARLNCNLQRSSL